jgi:hypothetical protein
MQISCIGLVSPLLLWQMQWRAAIHPHLNGRTAMARFEPVDNLSPRRIKLPSWKDGSQSLGRNAARKHYHVQVSLSQQATYRSKLADRAA